MPSINRKENYIDHNVRIENKSKYIEVMENLEEKSVNYRIYTQRFENIIKNRTTLYVLENVLNRIFHEEIREKQKFSIFNRCIYITSGPFSHTNLFFLYHF